MIQVKDKVEFYDNYIIITYHNYGKEGRNYGELFDFLGNYDIITASELGKDIITVEYDIYLFRDEDESDLRENGAVRLNFLSHLKDYINPEKENHRDFIRWFYNGNVD